MDRIYHSLLLDHFRENRQMAFVSGPRQVGKTTTACEGLPSFLYLNWDRAPDRLLITGNEEALRARLQMDVLQASRRRVVFDELHKYARWKAFLKGFFDATEDRLEITVTGSARLNVYRRGGDSLMGRYFLYRMHPLSLSELARTSLPDKSPVRPPVALPHEAFLSLLQFGGFPEPFVRSDTRFYNRWRRLRNEQLFKEDIRDMTNIHELSQLEVLAALLQHQVGQQVNYSTLAGSTGVSVDTIRRWLQVLESVCFCFVVRPYHRNVPKSLRRQPKVFLWDWSLLSDPGARHENMVASHLLKAVHFWTDAGLGDFDLFYLRDTAGREVDFLVTRGGVPWFLAEVKTSGGGRISKSLAYYHRLLKTTHAFQVQIDEPYVDRDCFLETDPVQVPARTLLSQFI